MPRPYRMHPALAVVTLLAGLSMAGVGLYTTYRNWVPN
jgi:hypothetical protein